MAASSHIRAVEGSKASRVGSTDEGRVRSPDTALFMHTGETDVAKALVKRYHYSRRWPGNVMLCCTWHEAGGLFGDSGEAVAACLFTVPPPAWSEPLWELSRLVRRDDADISLTKLIGAGVRFIQSKRMTDLIISYADTTQGHHGGIYQAGSWSYNGLRKPNETGVMVDGVFYPAWTARDNWGASHANGLRKLGIDATPVFDTGKHLYWRALSRSGQRKADRLGLLSLPYPKPRAA